MPITVPTCSQIASTLEGTARFLATIVAAVYVAGEMLGQAIHSLNDSLAAFATFSQRLTAQPLQTLLDLVPTVEPEPSVLAVLGATILEPEALELEIAAYDEAAKPARKRPVARRKPAEAAKPARKRPVARRKPAKATQDLVAA